MSRRDLGQDRVRDRRAVARGARDYLDAVGLKEPGLDRLIRAGYDLLRPRHLFHRRPEGSARLDHHARHQGAAGAGVIHTDFERGFIRAETIAYDDYVALSAKPARAMRASFG